MTFTEEVAAVAKAAAKFPGTFGLRAFPGLTFHIDVEQSYKAGDNIQLYVFTEDGKAFGKDTPELLRKEIVAAPA